MRSDIIFRCFKLIDLLDKKASTMNEIAGELGITRRNAYRYLEAASLIFPIYESRNVYPKRFTGQKEKMIRLELKPRREKSD